LRVLQRSGAVATSRTGADPGRDRYASEVAGDGRVGAVLRATEKGDRERREVVESANASPALTMFRVPRPVRTIRLRSRRKIDAEGES
jgi:hypothetical protein